MSEENNAAPSRASIGDLIDGTSHVFCMLIREVSHCVPPLFLRFCFAVTRESIAVDVSVP
jgi:hypothetical protein